MGFYIFIERPITRSFVTVLYPLYDTKASIIAQTRINQRYKQKGILSHINTKSNHIVHNPLTPRALCVKE